MLVNLYKTKTPIALFALPVMIGIIALHLLFVDIQIPSASFVWQTKLIAAVVSDPLVHWVFAFLIVYLSAIQLNRLVNNFGFFSKNTYLPGFIYVLVLFSFGQFSFNMLTIGYGLQIIGLGYIFRINRQDSAIHPVFIASLLFGLATICNLLLFSLFLLPWFALIIFRSFKWREWFMVIAGFGIPWLYCYVLYFFFTSNTALKFEGLPIVADTIDFSLPTITLYSFMTLITGLGCWRYGVLSSNQLLVFKKRSRILFHFIWLGLISYCLGWLVYDVHIISIAIPLTILFSVQILYAKSAAFYNVILYLWIGLIIVKIFFPV